MCPAVTYSRSGKPGYRCEYLGHCRVRLTKCERRMTEYKGCGRDDEDLHGNTPKEAINRDVYLPQVKVCVIDGIEDLREINMRR